MMKYENVHSDRLDSSLFADCEAAKKIYDEIYESDVMPGYIQEIMFIPFGFLLFSELQVIFLVTIRMVKPLIILNIFFLIV
jgi:hypothetical protein